MKWSKKSLNCWAPTYNAYNTKNKTNNNIFLDTVFTPEPESVFNKIWIQPAAGDAGGALGAALYVNYNELNDNKNLWVLCYLPLGNYKCNLDEISQNYIKTIDKSFFLINVSLYEKK